MNNADSFIDLHVHTNYSDGAFTPKETVEYANKISLSAISVTDHDTVDGIDKALKTAINTNLEVIPGIELSSEMILDSKKIEVHILGYFINHKSKDLKESLVVFRESRYKRALRILEKLKLCGIQFKSEDFIQNIESKVIGRLHFAKRLVEEDFVKSIQEAFQKYLAYGKPAYVPKYSISPQDAVKLVIDAQGIPVLAHPYYLYSNIEVVIRSLIEHGLKGIEVWHIKHSETAVKKFLKLAKQYDLLATGGSDCHGPFGKEHPIMGTVKVPYMVLESLKKTT